MKLKTTALCLLGAVAIAVAEPPEGHDPHTVHVFYQDHIHFTPDDPSRYDTPLVTASENGREIARVLGLGAPDGPQKITARVTIHPIPNDVAAVHDKWDRAGNVQLVPEQGPPVEIIKFVTSYGGRTDHEVDVSHLAPLLRGECTFRAFIDTWVTPAWKIDFSLTFAPVAEEETPVWMEPWLDGFENRAPTWVEPVFYEQNMTAELLADGPRAASVNMAGGDERVMLYYLVSGHCTDGSGADEFVSKWNVIRVDGEEVHRFKPWRADCRNFRDVNPYCRRWFEGSWSADFDRSGWCPGDWVEPVTVDVTETLPEGEHTVTFDIENVRPREGEHYGYWRVSAYIVGWGE